MCARANQRQCYESNFMFGLDDSFVDRAVCYVGTVAAITADAAIPAIATVTASAAIPATVPWLCGGGGKTSRGFAS